MSGKKFRFSLQRVLEWRQHEKERVQQNLARILNTYNRQKDKVAAARARLDALTRDRHADGLTSLRQHEAFRRAAAQNLRRAEQRLEEIEQELNTVRANLHEKHREEESLQTLYEHEKQQHKKSQSDAEAAFLDEQAVMRHGRNDLSSLL